MLLCAGGTGAPRRHAWDLKGKVSDMEGKMRNYQTRIKSMNEENGVLKGSMVQTQSRMAELEKEVETQKSKIRFEGDTFQNQYFIRWSFIYLLFLQ